MLVSLVARPLLACKSKVSNLPIACGCSVVGMVRIDTDRRIHTMPLSMMAVCEVGGVAKEEKKSGALRPLSPPAVAVQHAPGSLGMAVFPFVEFRDF